MSVQDILMTVEFQNLDPIVLAGEENFKELIKEAALEYGINENGVSLYYKKGERWMKIMNQKTFNVMVGQAARRGDDQIDFKIEQEGDNSSMGSEWEIVSTEMSADGNTESTSRMSEGEIKYRILPDERVKSILTPSLDLTLDNLSQMIQRAENISNDYICAFYHEKGAPLTGAMSQMVYTKASSVMKYNQTIYILVVRNFDHKSLPPLNPQSGIESVLVVNENNPNQSYTIKVDLRTTTVGEIKEKIYALTNIPTFELSLKIRKPIANSSNEYEEIYMTADIQKLSGYEFTEGDYIVWSIEYNLYPPTTYKEKILLNCPQTDKGRRTLHSMLYVIFKKGISLSFPFKQLLGIIRVASFNNTPLVHSLMELGNNRGMSLLDSLALEEGFCIICDHIIRNIFKKSENELPSEKLLEYSLDVVALLMNICLSRKLEVGREENYTSIDILCPLSYTTIKEPVFITKENGSSSYYDKNSIIEKVAKGQQIPELPNLDYRRLEVNEEMKLKFHSCNLNKKTETFEWSGTYNHLDITELFILSFRTGIPWMQALKIKEEFSLTKIIHPLSLKEEEFRNHLTLNKSREILINKGLTPCSVDKIDLLNVISQETTTIDVQELASALQNTNREESKNHTEQLSRTPLEAIVVCFDTSGSMGLKFCNDNNFTRISATKEFFESFADRTVGYNYHHAISLLLFSHNIKEACKFTENIQTFCYKIEEAKAEGGTALWVALKDSVDYLVEFKRDYPNCILRILCLSDGEDEHSNIEPLPVCKRILEEGIIVDSIVVGVESKILKGISFASGGYVYLPQTLEEGIKLFESETLLSVRNRIKSNINTSIEQPELNEFSNLPFSTEFPPMKRPEEIKQPKEFATDTLNKVAICPPTFSAVASGIRYKRIMRELHNLTQNPHPEINILPSQEDVSFWNVYMKGPSGTPYSGGTFELYVQFNENYPKNPPNIRFVTPIYHCNVNSTGKICHSVLDQFYTVDTTVRHILNCVYGLLMSPEPEDPLDTNIAAEYIHNHSVYVTKARDFTQRHALESFERHSSGLRREETHPAMYLDPITQQLMEDPVICIKTNKCYERSSIENIINQTGKDPETGVEISSSDLFPNIPLKQAIEEYKRNRESPWYNN